jgi:hypothetical protein
MPIKVPQASPVIGFGLKTKKSSEALPVRTIEVNTDAPFGSFAYELAVTAACLAAKAKEQAELQQQNQKSDAAIAA